MLMFGQFSLLCIFSPIQVTVFLCIHDTFQIQTHQLIDVKFSTCLDYAKIGREIVNGHQRRIPELAYSKSDRPANATEPIEIHLQNLYIF